MFVRGGIGAGGAVVAAGIIVAALVTRDTGDDAPPKEVANYGATSQPPWPIPDDPTAGIRAAGLTTDAMEGNAQHFHAHLDVYVRGKEIPLPSNIGIVPSSGEMSPLHTHDDTGLIHIESPDEDAVYHLGQLFKEWNVRLAFNQIGGLKAGNGMALTVYVDGKKTTGDPADIQFASHQQIGIVYGPQDSTFKPPSSYEFGENE